MTASLREMLRLARLRKNLSLRDVAVAMFPAVSSDNAEVAAAQLQGRERWLQTVEEGGAVVFDREALLDLARAYALEPSDALYEAAGLLPPDLDAYVHAAAHWPAIRALAVPPVPVCGRMTYSLTGQQTCVLPKDHAGSCRLVDHDCPDCGRHHGTCRQCGCTHGDSHDAGCPHAGRWR